AGSAQGILGDVTVTDTVAGITLGVDDHADPAARTVTLDSDPDGYGRIRGLTPGTIRYLYSGTDHVYLDTGAGAATVNVLAAGRPVDLAGHSAATAVNVGNGGNGGSLAGVLAPLYVGNAVAGAPPPPPHRPPPPADRAGRAVTLAPGSVTGLAPAAITYGTTSLNSLAVLGGRGGNTFAVQGTAAGAPVRIDGGGGSTLVGANAGNLWALAGPNAGT